LIAHRLPKIPQSGHFKKGEATLAAVAKYIRGLLERGQHHFTTGDAVQALGGDRKPISRALKRLILKKELASPQRSFYVIVPPEYSVLGCLPAEQFIPQLMEKAGEPYHVGLLSAAQLHGAAHHRPQRFQVMVGKPRSGIECGKICVDFHVRKDLRQVKTVAMNTPRGPVRVSSPEMTALELVGYVKHAGGLDNVATVLVDLAEVIDGARLVKEAAQAPLAWSQRLGFLLDLVEAKEAASTLLPYVKEHATRVAPLDAALPRTGSKRSERWRIAINKNVEVDS
jgi:predicted transcriptional regulator of viral defense system